MHVSIRISYVKLQHAKKNGRSRGLLLERCITDLWWQDEANPTPWFIIQLLRTQQPRDHTGGPYRWDQLYLIYETIGLVVLADGTKWFIQGLSFVLTIRVPCLRFWIPGDRGRWCNTIVICQIRHYGITSLDFQFREVLGHVWVLQMKRHKVPVVKDWGTCPCTVFCETVSLVSCYSVVGTYCTKIARAVTVQNLFERRKRYC